MIEKPKIHTLDLNIFKEDIDALGHVNNQVFLRWVQEASASHWDTLAPDSLKSSFRWVVLRHEIDYHKPIKFQDKIFAITWVQLTMTTTSLRCVEIRKENQLMARAITTWCLLDYITLKPKRIPEQIVKIFSTL